MHRRDFSRLAASSVAALTLPRLLRAATSPFARSAGTAPARTAIAAAPRVNGDRLNGWLTALSEFGKNPQGGVTRLAYSDADLKARAYATQLMKDAGLSVRVDAVGNIYGRREGTDANAKPIVFGSHVDSVPEGGNFDGPVGSLAAIEVARTFAEQKVVTVHPLEVVIWQNEEGGTYGSHLITSDVTPAELASVSGSGKTIAQGITAIGGDPSKLASARRKKGEVHGYLELHIEQGGNLDKEQLQIGIVEGIVGLRRWEVTIEGFANHAGTTPMRERKDAMLAAARFVEAVNRIVLSISGRQVATVGKIQAFPGAPNVVPGKVVCTLEIRDLDETKIQRVFERIAAEAVKIGLMNGTTFGFQEGVAHVSALCDARVRSIVGAAAKSLNLTTKSLPSGAGHDAQNLALICPMGMIFIPSIGGISHSPKEFSKAADITNGANVLAAAVLGMDATTF
jgi:N-carbamoyl-L-amino-acid hydrolase